MFSDSELTRIREATPIVELVSEYVQLKKSGTGYSGLCPFHGEKTPSFHVHPLKQCFHCFGCHKGGNVFTFLSLIEGIPFPESVRRLAKRAGIEIEERYQKPTQKIKLPANHDQLLKANQWAAKYFHYLLTEVPEYRFASDYLQQRGISQRAIKYFQIGVSPKGWNTLMDLMLKRDFTFDEIVAAGLAVAKEESKRGGYDRFRERLMFPIRNPDGQTLGFGARILKDEPNQPKYLNSPESPLFAKRQIWFGLYENQRGIRLRSEAVIVEGYMDVVGLWEHGVDNALATMGTALTEEHCSSLRPLANRVVTVFDSDSGGQEAWKRSVSLFLNAGIFAKDLSLPTGKDPDEFIQDRSKEEFYSLCEKAPRQITKLLREVAGQGSLSEEQISGWLEKLTPILIASRRLPDRALLWDNISLVLKVSIDALKEIAESGAKVLAGREPHKDQSSRVKSIPSKSTIPSKAKALRRYDPLELDLLKAGLKYTKEFFELLAQFPKDSWWAALKEEKLRGWLERLISGGEKGASMLLEQMLKEESEEVLLSLASESIVSSEPVVTEGASKDRKPAIRDLFERVTGRQRELSIRSMSAQVKLTERMGKDDEGIRLLEEVVKQRRQSLADRDPS